MNALSVTRILLGSILVLLCVSTSTTLLVRLQYRTIAWIVGVVLLIVNGLVTIRLLGQ